MPADPKIVNFYSAPEVTEHEKRNADLARLIGERHMWPRLQIAAAPQGGWDVVVRIDGAYSSREEAERMLEYFAHEAAGVPLTEDDVV